jgi:hypothetical protein
MVHKTGMCGHATTYEAAVHGFGAVNDLRKIRKELKEKYPPPTVPRVSKQQFYSTLL